MKGCRTGQNVKHVAKDLIASRLEVDLSCCRQLKSNCTSVRFCCKQHMRQCKKSKSAKPRGKRMCRTAEQVASLWQTLLRQVATPWAAILMILQLCLGERADAARQIRFGWFDGLLDAPEGEPVSINIPPGVNGKTQPRAVRLLPMMVRMLRKWLTSCPLHAADGSDDRQWPLQGQPVQNSDTCLFPGLQLRKGREFHRTWTTPISERAYYDKIRQAANVLQQERASYEANDKPHVWEGAALSKLGTHSMKRTAVVLLKDGGGSSAVVAAICGTTAKTLDRVYDEPTLERQERALSNAYENILRGTSD